MPHLPVQQFEFSTYDTDAFVGAANAHIDAAYAAGMQIDEGFFHAIAAYLSDINIQQKNGGPFGAMIVAYAGGLDKDGNGVGKPHVVGVGANHVVPSHDPSAHAEMVAYRDAAKRQGSSDLSGMALYSSCECCPMCLAIANGTGISKISYTNTRSQAEAIDFSDKLQYDMFHHPLARQMTSVNVLPAMQRKGILSSLGAHGAVVLDSEGQPYAHGDTDTSADPTGIASINAIRAAVKRCASEQKAVGNAAPVFSLPEGFTLVCKDIPHPAGLIAADWARMLRKRDATAPGDLTKDSKEPDPRRVVHVADTYEQLPHKASGGSVYFKQRAEITYQQPALPDEQRAIRTERYTGPVIQKAAAEVFDAWKEATSAGLQTKY